MKRQRLESLEEEIPEPVDRISDLPDAIIHQIMWFLPTKDAVKTSVLSKRFKSMWRSNLVLDFDDTYNIQWNSEHGKKLFSNFIRHSIRRHRVLDLSLRKFRLHFSTYSATSKADKQIDSAMRYGMTRKPQELDLGYSNFCCHGAFFYEPPSEIFIGGSSIRVLKLKGMKLDRFHITQFPLIEELSLIGCGGLNSIRVSSDVIKIIEIKQCLWLSSIEVLNSDNLISFSYHGIEFSNNTELNSCHIEIISCMFLETLEIKDSDHVTDKWVEEIMSNFKFLKKLILVGCHKLNKIETSHEQLEIFKLMGCVRLEEVEILAPNLTSFAYRGGIIQTSLTIDSSKLDAELNLYIGPESARGFHRLRDFVACFDHCKSLTLNLGSDKVLLVTQDQKDDFLPPLFDLKNLKVKFSAPVKDYVVLVDSLLWFAPLLETISIVADYSEKFLKLKYNKAVVMGETDLFCCHARLIKCWRHYLKNVVMENFDTFEKESMVKFFTRRAMRLERISDTSIEDIS